MAEEATEVPMEAEAAATEAPVAAKPEPDFSEGVKALLERTGYSLDVTSGQRKYGGPPPGWEGPVPGTGEEKFVSQIFIGKINREILEDDIVPALEEYGDIYEFRLMVDNRSGVNKGYGFCIYTTKDAADAAVKGLDGKELKGMNLTVKLSRPNVRLFIGSIPKTKTKEQIIEELKDKVEELNDVILYMDPENKTLNRGFAFLDFATHKDASVAKKKLSSGKVKVFGMTQPPVDWAEPEEEPDEEVMATVKVVYVANIPASITEEKINEMFAQYGDVEKSKKIKNYAFIHFLERDSALSSIEALNGHEVEGSTLEVSLAKPQSTSKKEKLKKLKDKQFRGRGRGRGGNFGVPDGYAVVYVGNGYDGYDQGYGGYEEYYAPPPMRARGGPRGAPRGRPMRPYGRPPMRAGVAPRGGPRGRPMRGGPMRGAPVRGRPMGRAGMKRPAAGAAGVGPAKRPMASAWEAAPIPQKPLHQQYGGAAYDYGADYGADYSGNWYQEGYGQQW